MHLLRYLKAGLNMLTVREAHDSVRAVCVGPGWAQTRMGGEVVIITTDASAEGLLEDVGKVRTGEHGSEIGKARLAQYVGEKVPWWWWMPW